MAAQYNIPYRIHGYTVKLHGVHAVPMATRYSVGSMVTVCEAMRFQENSHCIKPRVGEKPGFPGEFV